jgi:hypothetical protein
MSRHQRDKATIQAKQEPTAEKHLVKKSEDHFLLSISLSDLLNV